MLPDGQYALVNLFGHACIVGRVQGVSPYGIPMLQVECIFRDQLLPPVLHTSRMLYRVTPLTKEQAQEMQAGTIGLVPADLHFIMDRDLYDQAVAERDGARAALKAARNLPESVAHAMNDEPNREEHF